MGEEAISERIGWLGMVACGRAMHSVRAMSNGSRPVVSGIALLLLLLLAADDDAVLSRGNPAHTALAGSATQAHCASSMSAPVCTPMRWTTNDQQIDPLFSVPRSFCTVSRRVACYIGCAARSEGAHGLTSLCTIARCQPPSALARADPAARFIQAQNHEKNN